MYKQIVGLVGLGLLSFYAQANTHCPNHYLMGKEPVFINQKLANKTQEVCFSEFVVMHSGVSRTPLWSAEHLTKERLENAKTLRRTNSFHSEDAISVDERSELSDYSKSGFDRGHLSPSADMPTERAQYESFSLANMIPQNPKNNRYLWESIESAVRYQTLQRGELYVITGVLFQGTQLQRLNERVLVPTHIYKAFYDPNRNEGGAYFVKNEAEKAYEVLSIAELENRIGLNLFPKLSAESKNTVMSLPKPKTYRERQKERVNQ
jgi:endonuclease G, mitochondrial